VKPFGLPKRNSSALLPLIRLSNKSSQVTLAACPKIGNLLFLIFYQMKQAMPTRISMIALAINCFWLYPFAQGSVSATYTAADIPTSFNAFSPPCNGSSIQLQVVLPAGESYPVTGINIAYSMTALGVGQMAHQRSQVKCVNTGLTETTVYEGVGAATGTYPYARQGVNIANGGFAGGTVLLFEIHAWRTVEGTAGCNTSVNRVNAGTWTITVFYGSQVSVPRVGVNNSAPAAALDVAGKIKLADDFTLPQAGMVRWNAASGDFEGYNGKEWLSLTKADKGWGENALPTENEGVTSPAMEKEDFFGAAVSMSGDYAIIGAPMRKVGTNEAQGMAYIFVRSSSGWMVQAILKDDAGAGNDYYGRSVSISGDYAVVGVENKDIAAKANQGCAFVYYRSGSNWNLQATLTAGDGAAGDLFGGSVGISGSYLIIGAAGKMVDTHVFQGKAYVFNRAGTVWNEQSELTAEDGAAQEYFGGVVGISGNYAVVGVRNKAVNNQSNAGQAYVFYRRPGLPGLPGVWLLQAVLVADDGTAGDGFGSSVAISGDFVLIGAPYKTVYGNANFGQAYLFGKTGAGWQQQSKLLPNDGAMEARFGSCVAISGDYAIVTSPYKKVEANANQGKGYVYMHSGNTWVQQTSLAAGDGMANDVLGITGAAVGSAGIIIGAPYKDVNGITNAGKVYFFKRN